MLGDALFEFVQFGVGTVGLCIDRRPCKKFIKSLLHFRPYVRPDISLVRMVNGVSQKIYAVKDIICTNLLVMFFSQLSRVKILGVSHLTKTRKETALPNLTNCLSMD